MTPIVRDASPDTQYSQTVPPSFNDQGTENKEKISSEKQTKSQTGSTPSLEATTDESEEFSDECSEYEDEDVSDSRSVDFESIFQVDKNSEDSESQAIVDRLILSAVFCTTSTGFDYEKFSKILQETATSLQVKHPDWSSETCAFKTYTYATKALTQIIQNYADTTNDSKQSKSEENNSLKYDSTETDSQQSDLTENDSQQSDSTENDRGSSEDECTDKPTISKPSNDAATSNTETKSKVVSSSVQSEQYKKSFAQENNFKNVPQQPAALPVPQQNLQRPAENRDTGTNPIFQSFSQANQPPALPVYQQFPQQQQNFRAIPPSTDNNQQRITTWSSGNTNGQSSANAWSSASAQNSANAWNTRSNAASASNTWSSGGNVPNFNNLIPR